MIISEPLLFLDCLQNLEKHNGARWGSGFHAAVKHVYIEAKEGVRTWAAPGDLGRYTYLPQGAFHPCFPLQASQGL